MTAPAISVLTLVRGRQTHLDALVRSLQQQADRRFELIIASMQPTPPAVNAQEMFPVTVVTVTGDALPLAAARNAAVQHANTGQLVFLDVDCIASPSLVHTYSQLLQHNDMCLMGEVRYLPQLDVASVPFVQLVERSYAHPARPSVHAKPLQVEPNPRRLWALSFAIRRDRYLRAGGMDDRYVGYGGEETDFAERLALHSTTFAWCADAIALHQYHPVHSPPLDKFIDIVRNARLFYSAWGSWCMEYWLGIFRDRGYLDWQPEQGVLNIQRYPSPAEVRSTRLDPEIAFG